MIKPDSPEDLNISVYLMTAPFVSSFNNEVKNNALMKDGVKINYNKAFQQWLALYRYIGENGLVYVLPNEGWYQDIIYVANMGLVLAHTKEPTVILSNFTSPPRQGEEKVGETFFRQMKYAMYNCPYKFEGEADLKWVRNRTYIGGYGIRTQRESFIWMQDKFDCNITAVEMRDRKCYHWDCCLFVLDKENALVNVGVLDDDEVRKIEKVINVIDVPKPFKYSGVTNLARINSTILCRDVDPPVKKWLDKVAADHGCSVRYFPLDSQDANGADLSCMVMHMNYPASRVGSSVVAAVRNFLKR